jgi:hypothetical protein
MKQQKAPKMVEKTIRFLRLREQMIHMTASPETRRQEEEIRFVAYLSGNLFIYKI